MVAQEEEWQLYSPEGRPLEIPKPPFKIPGVWDEDNHPGLAQNVPPSSGRTKAESQPRQPETVLHSLQDPGQNSKTL
jgi:hypothetical protein